MTDSPITISANVLAWQAQARNDGLMLTNLFPDERKMADWARRDAAVAVRTSGITDARLLVIHEDGFDRLFYAAKTLDAVARMCGDYAGSHRVDCVLDVVGAAPIQDAAKVALGSVGFSVRKSLTRMQRRKDPELGPVNAAATVRAATEADSPAIHATLHHFFDARAEQLPCLEEVKSLCTGGASFVVETDGALAAFLLGELLGKRGTVRYWFTMPAGRGKGVGGGAMHAFLNLCLEKESSYQELWVLDDNENAIKRYQHYGFAFDRLKDTVFIKETVNMKERIVEILKEIRPEFEFEGVENFFDEGMLDSFDLVTLVTSLEAEYKVKIDGAAILPENFANVDSIVALMQKSGARA